MRRWAWGSRDHSGTTSAAGAGGLGDVWRSRVSFEGPGQIDVGPYTYWNPTARFATWGPHSSIAVGAYCSIAHNVQILAGGDHGVSRLSTYAFSLLDEPPAPEREPLRAEKVVVGNDVWIGTGAIIVGPVTIGDGTIVGAGAVVASDVPAYALVGGVPARLIRMRLPEAAISTMQQLAWWNWPVESVRGAESLLRGEDVDALADYAIGRGLFEPES